MLLLVEFACLLHAFPLPTYYYATSLLVHSIIPYIQDTWHNIPHAAFNHVLEQMVPLTVAFGDRFIQWGTPKARQQAKCHFPYPITSHDGDDDDDGGKLGSSISLIGGTISLEMMHKQREDQECEDEDMLLQQQPYEQWGITKLTTNLCCFLWFEYLLLHLTPHFGHHLRIQIPMLH